MSIHSYITKFFVLGTLFFSKLLFSAEINPDITVIALKDSRGSEWLGVNDKSNYLVSYKIIVTNHSEKIVYEGRMDKTCIYLDDDEGLSLLGYEINPVLLSKPYQPGESREGIIYFSSQDPDLISLPYVKMGEGKKCTEALTHKKLYP